MAVDGADRHRGEIAQGLLEPGRPLLVAGRAQLEDPGGELVAEPLDELASCTFGERDGHHLARRQRRARADAGEPPAQQLEQGGGLAGSGPGRHGGGAGGLEERERRVAPACAGRQRAHASPARGNLQTAP